MTDMGTFRIEVELENTARPGERQPSDATCSSTPVRNSPGFRTPRSKRWGSNAGRRCASAKRAVPSLPDGPAPHRFMLGEGGPRTKLYSVNSGDLVLLGARSLEGLNVMSIPCAKCSSTPALRSRLPQRER